jgi:predicted negative regulator of RcsB-dependent stress response
MLLTVGAVAGVQVIDARAGLDAATMAAAAAAARAPDSASAEIVAQNRFLAIVAGYPLRSPRLAVVSGQFGRNDQAIATATGVVDISWASLVFPARLTLASRATVPLEPWRTHRQSS